MLMCLWFTLFQYVCWFILYIIYLFMFNIFRYKFFLPHMCDAGMQMLYSDRCLCLADQWPVAHQTALDVSSKAGALRINMFSERQILEQERFFSVVGSLVLEADCFNGSNAKQRANDWRWQYRLIGHTNQKYDEYHNPYSTCGTRARNFQSSDALVI